jgi:hypothetical protein
MASRAAFSISCVGSSRLGLREGYAVEGLHSCEQYIPPMLASGAKGLAVGAQVAQAADVDASAAPVEGPSDAAVSGTFCSRTGKAVTT